MLMIKLLVLFQFSALVPIVVLLLKRPRLNHFFKFLLASILLSIAFDIIGDIFFFQNKSNTVAYCIYYLCNALLVTFMWQKIPFYDEKNISLVKIFGYTGFLLMVSIALYLGFTIDTMYFISCVSVFLGLLLALQYYTKKIQLTSMTPLLKDPYFITATGYILFCLSTIIILASQIFFKDVNFGYYTWTLRQAFYMVYNFIIAYAFYTLYKSQINR